MATITLSALLFAFLPQIAPLPPASPQDPAVGRPAGPVAIAARPLRLESVKATIRIAETTATTELEQVFRNTRPAPSEETYLWPLPEGATVSQFELWVDGKPQKAEILDRDRARGVYEEIVRSRRDPGLLEWAGLGCVRCSVFPVPANGVATVRLRYVQMLGSTGAAFEYAMPLRGADLAPGGLRSFVVDGAIEWSRALAAVYSPSHSLDVRRDGETRARFSFEAVNGRLDRDLSILLTPAERDLGALLVTHRRENEDGYFSLVLTPRVEVPVDELIAKDVIFVVDTSGSMAGAKIEQTRKALRQALPRLRAQDRFALLRFSTEAEAFRPEPIEASAGNLEAARRWIDELEARGGTNLEEALSRALQMPRSEGRISMVFFLTDGLPTVGVTDEKQILASVRERNSRGLRIFTFGVGFDVNTRLLDTIAGETRAAREYVSPQEDVEVKVSALFDKVSSPVLTNLTLALDGAEARDVVPKQLPDLFRGSQLVVTGRYRGFGRAAIRLSGNLQNTKKETVYEVELPRVNERNDSLRALWASRKVGYLLDEIRLHGASPELVEEVRRLGREHNIVTPYTSFLVVEEGQRLVRALGPSFRVLPVGAPGTSGGNGPGSDALDFGFLDTEAKLSRERLADLSTQSAGEGAVGASQTGRDLGAAAGAAPASPGLPGPSGPTTPSAGGGTYRGPGDSLPTDREGRARALEHLLTRTVGARVFRRVGDAWVDGRFAESDRAKLVKVKFLSAEYFALLKRAPELAACFALGSHVLVQHEGAFYEVE